MRRVTRILMCTKWNYGWYWHYFLWQKIFHISLKLGMEQIKDMNLTSENLKKLETSEARKTGRRQNGYSTKKTTYNSQFSIWIIIVDKVYTKSRLLLNCSSFTIPTTNLCETRVQSTGHQRRHVLPIYSTQRYVRTKNHWWFLWPKIVPRAFPSATLLLAYCWNNDRYIFKFPEKTNRMISTIHRRLNMQHADQTDTGESLR